MSRLLFYIFAGIFLLAIILFTLLEKNIFSNLIGKFFPFQATVIETLPSKKEVSLKEGESTKEKAAGETGSVSLEKEISQIRGSLTELGERINEMEEKIDALSQKKEKVASESKNTSKKKEEIGQEEVGQEEIGQVGQKICEKKVGDYPKRNKVIFNEIAWMGSILSANDEWIELKNISGSQIDLTGWQILNKDQNIKIIFSSKNYIGQTPAIFLLERTSDDSVPGVPADWIYTGALRNSDETLYLFDQNCQLQDEVSANPDWPAGDKTSKRTMERKTDFSWQTSLNPGGTPRRENSTGYIEASPTASTASSSAGAGAAASYSRPQAVFPKLLISEIQILPAEKRFIELYNPNDQALNLTGWYIQRKTKTAITWTSLVSANKFSGKEIQPKSHFLIAGTSNLNPDIFLDDLILTEDNVIQVKNPNQDISDKVGWGGAQDYERMPAQNPQSGESIGRKFVEESYQDTDDNSNDFEIQNPTPKWQNKTKTEEPIKDTTPPVVNFLPLSSLQTTLNFTISWIGEDPLDTATPSGIDGFFLQYSVSPSDVDGIQYQDQEGNWQKWKENEILEIGVGQNQLTLLGKDEYSYNFKIKAKDIAGNESDWIGLSTKISLPKTILINEVQIAGEDADNDFIELYNPNDIELDISGYKLRKKTSTGSEYSIKIFPKGSKISARGFFLWANSRGDFHLLLEADIWTTETLAQNNSIALFNSEDLLIDALAWGESQNPFVETSPFPQNPEKNQSLERINFQDTDNNSQDFVLQLNPTPQNSKF